MKEIWKDVKGYEGLYQVSNFGRVKSLNYNNTKKAKILIPKVIKNTGYLRVCLCKNGKVVDKKIHRLVMETFDPNKNTVKKCFDEEINFNKLCVNHIDENKLNCKLSNLEWCTHKYNDNYGSRPYKLSISHRKSQ